MPNPKTGRSYLLILLTAFLLCDLGFPYLDENLPSTQIKTLIISTPLLFQLKGYKWAFWVGGILLFLNAALFLLLGFELSNLALFPIGLINLVYAMMPLIFKDVRVLMARNLTKIKNEVVYPYLVTRYKAAFIDAIFMFILFALTMMIIQNSEARPTAFIIYVCFIILYEPFMIHFFTGTIGHHCLNIEVRCMDNVNNRLSFINALFRSIIKFMLGWISFLTIGFNEEHRALHDIAGSSIVLYKKKV